LDKRFIIKADVEGHEYRAVTGAESLLARPVAPIWLVEITLNEFHPLSSNPTFAPTFDLFWRHGYRSFRVEADKLCSVGREDVERWTARGTTGSPWFNYLFLPPGISMEAIV
jgi:hypothetical protein